MSCALLLCSCQRRPPEEPSLGVAYAGPATLNLRKDLSSRSPAITTVRHGEELQILETRRRFARVRAADGSQGWTDANLLLSSQQMDTLKQLAARAAALPSQGSASVSELLNVHTEPARLSPSFYQIAEGASVEVVGHSVAPRQAPVPSIPNAAGRNPDAKKVRTKQAKAAPLIPPPAPAGPPSNWVQLSRPRAADLPGYVPPAPAAPPATDDWSLVRTRDNKAGWVLSRMLFMSVPDEIAQYAEGHRITAYLALGDVKDGDQIKQNWLWTTVTPGNKCCEFDSFRVFVWSIKHHRYETAYIERNVSGFYPVQLAAVPGSQEKGFSLVLQDKDGKLYQRTYAFAGYHVRMIAREPAAPALEHPSEPKVSRAQAAAVPANHSLWASLTARVQQWWRREAR
ncbi:MAG TPA: SH3 domain-containing protein [Bryobacteraceae bacterium]|nr:SH3 domain-containing protein [Bryobacteraceae bacterium]